MARTQPPDVRREQLLDAAERTLLERGLRATTVADVARAAGVAKGTTYLYFRSKDELLVDLRARYLERYLATVATGRGTARTKVRRLVVGLVQFGIAHHELHHLLFHEAGISEDDAYSPVRSQLADLLRAGSDAGELAVGNPEVTAAFLLHGVDGTLVEAGGSGRADRRLGPALTRLVDRALTAPA